MQTQAGKDKKQMSKENVLEGINALVMDAKKKKQAEVNNLCNKIADSEGKITALEKDKERAEKAVDPDKVYDIEQQINRAKKAVEMYTAEKGRISAKTTREFMTQDEINEQIAPVTKYLDMIRRKYADDIKDAIRKVVAVQADFEETEGSISRRLNYLNSAENVYPTGNAAQVSDFDYTAFHNLQHYVNEIVENARQIRGIN